MKITKRPIISLCLCIGIIAICIILITLLSGFRHEYKKFKQVTLTLVAVLLIRYIFLEHIAFLIQALFLTLKGQNEIEPEYENYEFSPMEFLKLRLRSLKSQLNLPKIHRDEAVNWEYKHLTEDLCLFGRYFFLLLLVVVHSHNSYTYYNTAITRRMLYNSYFSIYKMKQLLTINDLNYWINHTLTAALNEGYDYAGSRIDEPGWVQFQQSKLLGVVRLQQVRHARKEKGMIRQYFDREDYLPGWQKMNRSLPYMDKYWRIYHPWLAKQYEGVINWLMTFATTGSLYTYSRNNGYVSLLARDQKNSGKILQFLKEKFWLDAHTAAVFMDFTLYNADSNLFTICSILVEQTPFGSLVWQINVESAELLWNMNEISMWWWLLIILYVFQMLQFCKVMILRSWFAPGFFKSSWNCVDFIIVLLNISLVVFTLLRNYYVKHVMETFLLAKKHEYVNFRIAYTISYMGNVTLGLLICLASIRIWKVLQFASIFRIFNRTLYTSGVSLISTILIIYIFLFAIGKSAQILNGSHSKIFVSYLKSITSIMSFSFGFNSAASPDDLSRGSDIFSFILYLILMFVVAIFLINMFIALICDHFANAREERDQESTNKLTYWQFLSTEYKYIKLFFKSLLPFCYKTKNQTISENINNRLNELDNKSQDQELMANARRQEDNEFEDEEENTDHIRNIATVLNLQIEILDRLIMDQSFDWDSENEDSD